MTCKTVLMAFVALAMCVLVASTAAEVPISQNAAVRRHASIQARPARRSIDLARGQRLRQKRQTAEQLAQAAELKKWDDDFHAKNAEWQQAAIADLNQGKTPLSFDEYWNGKSSSSGSSSGSASDDDSSQSSSSTPVTSSDSSSPTPSTTSNYKATDKSNDCDTEEASTSTRSAASAAKSHHHKNHAKDHAKQLAKGSSTSSSSSSSPSSVSTSGKSYTGQGTYFATGLGACGITNSDSDRIVAISHTLFDSFGTGNPNNNPVCGHKIKATYKGKSTTVTVVDRCEGCAVNDLDFTETAFQDLADLSLGRLNGVTWQWVGSAP